MKDRKLVVILIIIGFVILLNLIFLFVVLYYQPSTDFLEDRTFSDSYIIDEIDDEPFFEIDDDSFYEFEDEFFFEMEAEDCFEGELYDPLEKICYIECETEDECIRLEQEILEKAEKIGDLFFEDEEDFNEFAEEDITILAKYKIDNGNIILFLKPELVDEKLKELQDDFSKHQKIWDRFKTLIPLVYAPFLVEFHIATDGKEETFGATETNENNVINWNLIVDIEDAFIGNKINDKELTYTLIHEFGHLLTLNLNQVDVSNNLLGDISDLEYEQLYFERANKCKPRYFVDEGCTRESSYLNLFFKEFWSGIYNEYTKILELENDDAFYEAQEEFYEKRANQFITDYAATNPGEDIAESWTAFILQKKPAGNSISDKKILFFYDFPELVKLRKVIRARL